MGRNADGMVGTILGLPGAESHSTLSLYLNDGQERHYSTANEAFTAGGRTFVPGLVMASELSQVIGSQPSRVPVAIDNVDRAIEEIRVADWVLWWRDYWTPVPAQVLKTFVHP